MVQPEELKTIDSVGAEPEEYPQNGDPYLPKFAVTVFFQHRDEAEAFIKAASG